MLMIVPQCATAKHREEIHHAYKNMWNKTESRKHITPTKNIVQNKRRKGVKFKQRFTLIITRCLECWRFFFFQPGVQEHIWFPLKPQAHNICTRSCNNYDTASRLNLASDTTKAAGELVSWNASPCRTNRQGMACIQGTWGELEGGGEMISISLVRILCGRHHSRKTNGVKYSCHPAAECPYQQDVTSRS